MFYPPDVPPGLKPASSGWLQVRLVVAKHAGSWQFQHKGGKGRA